MKNENMDVRFSNFVFNKNKYYFVFISELKAYGIGHFFKEAISKALFIPMGDIEFITIAPDLFEQYNYDNLIIISDIKDRENKRDLHEKFIKDISKSKYINFMLDQILQNQNELYIYMFESSRYMTLDKKENVILVGPKSEVVEQLSNKIALYEIFSEIVPMAQYKISNGYEKLLEDAEEIFRKTHNKLFVSLETSAAGANSIIADSLEDIMQRFHKNHDDIFLLSEYVEHSIDPTVLAVVINEDEVFIAGIADQKIEGTSFRGSTFPSLVSEKVKNELIRQTRLVGKKMAQLGYRGIFGCDYIIAGDKKVFFIETNPRKQGTTMEFCCALRTMLPLGSPNLPELEFYAVTENMKAPRMREPDYFKNPDIYWSTYNVKMNNRMVTHSYLPQQRGEIEMFESVAKNKLTKEYMILEHIGQDFFVNEGSFLGRVIATGKNYKDVDDGIRMGKKMIDFTIKSAIEFELDSMDDKCINCVLYKNYELEKMKG